MARPARRWRGRHPIHPPRAACGALPRAGGRCDADRSTWWAALRPDAARGCGRCSKLHLAPVGVVGDELEMILANLKGHARAGVLDFAVRQDEEVIVTDPNGCVIELRAGSRHRSAQSLQRRLLDVGEVQFLAPAIGKLAINLEA